MHRHLWHLVVALALFSAGNVASGAILLAVDINDRTVGDPTATDPANTASGFEAWSIDTGTTGAVATASRTLPSGYTVRFDIFDDMDPNDGGAAGDSPGMFDDRDRVVPTTSPTLNQLYDDFIFAGGSAGPTGGLDLSISGGALMPNTPYFVSIYAYDGIDANMASATQIRTANWHDGNNSDTLLFTAEFTINMPPTTDDQYKFTGIAQTDGTGALLLKGRRVTAADVAVYVNGIEVREIPEPMSLVLLGLASLAIVGWRRS